MEAVSHNDHLQIAHDLMGLGPFPEFALHRKFPCSDRAYENLVPGIFNLTSCVIGEALALFDPPEERVRIKERLHPCPPSDSTLLREGDRRRTHPGDPAICLSSC